jgi:hypothetical protein
MKIHHTKYKQLYEAYILQFIEDEDGNQPPNKAASVEMLYKRIWKEKGWQIERDGMRVAVIDWLKGLALPIAHYNDEIIDLAIDLQSIDENPSDKLKEQVVNNYWSFMANIILGMERKNDKI